MGCWVRRQSPWQQCLRPGSSSTVQTPKSGRPQGHQILGFLHRGCSYPSPNNLGQLNSPFNRNEGVFLEGVAVGCFVWFGLIVSVLALGAKKNEQDIVSVPREFPYAQFAVASIGDGVLD